MLPAHCKRFVPTVPVFVLCASAMLAGSGCGWQPSSILATTADNGGNQAGSNPADQTPSPDSDSDNPTEPSDLDPNGDPQVDDGSEDNTPFAGDVPQNGYCEPVTDWDATWIEFENEVLGLVNQHRAAGADCGSTGAFGPADPLTMNVALRCAARNHSMDMGTEGYFDHYTPEGSGPGDRLDEAGYSGSAWAENIAWGYATPAVVVSGWMASPGHCSNIMQPHLTETGVGYYAGNLWTQTFGRP